MIRKNHVSKKQIKKGILSCAMSAMLVLSTSAPVLAAGPSGVGDPSGGTPGGAPGGSSSSSSVTWSGATEYTSAGAYTGQTYSSTTADQNAVLIDTSDAVTLTNPTVTKSGGTSASDNYSFYGINSGIMVKGGSTTTITGAKITTDAAGANGVFSYGANNGTTNATGDGTTVNISDSTITTTAQGSGGIMTTYGGTTVAKNLIVTTSGGSSAPIRTDRGGGWVTVTGGTYTSSGQGSPAIYSTAEVKVSDATLVSNLSEGVCIEGTGSIELTNCSLTANNTSLNGNAQFYDTIMIYQSQSGDASSGTSAFTMTGGSLTSKNGDVFHVTNTTANINLNGVSIVNEDSDGVLLSVCDDGWSGGSNVATVNAADQTMEGTLLVGSDSTLNLNLSGSTTFTGKTSGVITNDKSSSVSSSIGTVAVTMSGGNAVWKLTGDSTISSISGSGKIDYNGYTLTVGSTKYTSGSPGGSIEDASGETELKAVTFNNVSKSIKYSKLKKKAVSYSVIKASDGGKVTYKVTKGKKKYIKVSKAGKVTVKKGAVKGTYKVKLTVAAKGNYKKTTKTITIKVK